MKTLIRAIAIAALGLFAATAKAEPYTLNQDEDWSGRTADLPIAVDLNGHVLDIDGAALAGIVFTGTSDTQGVLRVAVGEGESVTMDPSAVSGNLKLAKTGSGELVVPPVGIETECLQGKLTVKGEMPITGMPIHRWSFTEGSLVDSIGGTTAVLLGNKKDEVVLADNAVSFPGGGTGDCYLDLGADMIPSSGAVTIEIWGTQKGLQPWSRIWCVGSGEVDYLTMAWTWSNDVNTDYVQLQENQIDHFRVNGTMGPYTLDTRFHISMKIIPRTDGRTDFIWAKRDAETGAILKSGGAVSRSGWSLAKYAGAHFWINHGFQNTDACASYDEVRIWNWALSDQELTDNAKAGPDVIPERGAEGDNGGTLVEAPAMIHRWSFTDGSLVDSVGGSTASLVGSQSGAVTFANNAVTFPGGGNGACYLDLGAGMIPSSGAATIEVWGKQNAAQAWSRIWNVGTDAKNFMTMAWTWNTDVNQDFVQVQKDGKDIFRENGKTSPYTLGTCFHISMKIIPRADGQIELVWAKRDATTGLILNSGSKVVAWSRENYDTARFWINHGFANNDAAATYDEVRVWNYALSDRELYDNAKAGPDVIPEKTVKAPEVIHRWSFTNGSLADSVGGATAELVGARKEEVTLANNAITFPGGANGDFYLDLGADMIPSAGDVTIEIWGTQNQVKDYSHIWNVGTDGKNLLTMAWSWAGNVNQDYVQVLENNAAHFRVNGKASPYTLGTCFHISMKIIPRIDGKTDFIWAKRDAATGAVLNSGFGETTGPWTLAKYAGAHFWINHSFSDSDAAATYDEVRIWKGALSEDQLTRNARLGPDKLEIVPSCGDGVCGTLDIASGATLSTIPAGAMGFCNRLKGTGTLDAQSTFVVEQELDIAGEGFGSFTVDGVLKVNGDWIFSCGSSKTSDRVVGTGVFDLSKAGFSPCFVSTVGSPYLAAEGVTLVGYENMEPPRFYRLDKVDDKLYFSRNVTAIFVR